MDSARSNANNRPGAIHQLLPIIGPMLLIAVGYLDPGKWAATVEASSRYGTDLAAVMFIFNLAAILCHYLSARIAVVTGRDLAQICSEEYDKGTCIFLGIQAEMSVVLLDLTMVLGIAHGLNLLFGWDLFTCVFLTAANALLYPLFSSLLDTCKEKFLCGCIYVAGFILLSFVLGVFISQPQMPLSVTGMLTKFSGESAFSLMSLLGASIMPHSFYLYSSIVQQHQQQQTVSKDTVSQNHFVAIFCMFSGIYLVNYVLMTLAANAFYTSPGLLTFQDAMSLIEQVFWGPIVPIAFLLVLFLSTQITNLSWSLGGQSVLNEFLKLDLPGWLHCATIRIIAVVPALYFVWSSGAEGMYQLLVSTQVLAALLLPSSVIPLFRVAASRQLMGAHKISQFAEFLAIITLIGMLGLKVVFVVEMLFGNSDWVDNLRWDAGSSMTVLLITASASFCLMIWLATTPLKSASTRIENQVWNWDSPKGVSDAFRNSEETDIVEHNYQRDADTPKHVVPSPSSGEALDRETDTAVASYDFSLPETLMEPEQELQLPSIQENSSLVTFPHSAKCNEEEPTSVVASTCVPTAASVVSDVTLPSTCTLKHESTAPVEKTLVIEGDSPAEKDDDEGDSWENEDSMKEVTDSTVSVTSEGPGSFRSLNAKGDDGGSGAGSLSRLAGLGRAARRQLAAALDEFWGQLYDFHGNVVQEAKAKKLDLLLGSDSKVSASAAASAAASSLLKDDTVAKEVSGYFPSIGADPLMTSSIYDSVNQQRLQNSLESSYGTQRAASSLWPGHIQLVDAYVHNSNRNVIDIGERRYSSVRSIPSSDLSERRYSSVRSIPSPDLSERRYSSVRNITTSDLGGERRYSSVRSIPSAENWDYQPATMHGYQTSSYFNCNDRCVSNLSSQMESPALNSASSLGAGNYRDSLAFSMGQKLQNGLSPVQASGYQNLSVSRHSPLQSDRPNYDMPSPGNSENAVNSANAKKYHSLPDIHRDPYKYGKTASRDPPPGFGITSYESSLYPKSGARRGVGPLGFDELSPSHLYKDVPSSQPNSTYGTGSLWSRQPFEQFGVTDNNRSFGTAVGSRAGSASLEATTAADSEEKLLQSFRHCIVKLLKLEGSDWLFNQNDGVDEDIIDRVAAREKILYEAETREINRTAHMGESPYPSADRKSASVKMNDMNLTHLMVSSVPNCGENCIWRSDLIISFGVWCIHRILDLSLMESRPELWGKYTYVLNRLQGIVDAAFSKPRTPRPPCFCLQIAAAQQQKSSPTFSSGMLPPAAKPAKGKCTTAITLLDIIKDVEISISCRKGRTGTAAGDVAFPKGKENLASVLKRYKRRLANKPVGIEGPSGSRKGAPASAPYVS